MCFYKICLKQHFFSRSVETYFLVPANEERDTSDRSTGPKNRELVLSACLVFNYLNFKVTPFDTLKNKGGVVL